MVGRCGAFGTTTGSVCILPTDHGGEHVLDGAGIDDILDLYAPDARPFSIPIGDNHLKENADGSVTISRKPAKESRSSWKGARRILSLPDEAIQAVPRRGSKVIDFHIGSGTVSWPHGKSERYLCHHHGSNDCPCIRRVSRWRKERAA